LKAEKSEGAKARSDCKTTNERGSEEYVGCEYTHSFGP